MNSTEIAVRRHRTAGNCFIWGCFGGVALLVLGVLIVFFAGRLMVYIARNQFTDDVPIALPQTTFSAERISELEQRVEDFRAALRGGEADDPLVLTEDEINALIQHHEDLEGASGRLFVRIQDGVIVGEMSIPLEGMPGFSGRYFNGSATFNVEFSDGKLYVSPISATVRGRPVPEQYLKPFREDNIAAEWQRENSDADDLKHVQDIRIENGRIIIEPKTTRTGSSGDAPSRSPA